jgi:hypothetical protein
LLVEATVRTIRGYTVAEIELTTLTRMNAWGTFSLAMAGFFFGQTVDWSRDWLNRALMPVPVYLTITFGLLCLLFTFVAIVLFVQRHKEVETIKRQAANAL